ncbi:MAG: M14 family zinc carboxypeptidase [Minisyncoccia bacterium]
MRDFFAGRALVFGIILGILGLGFIGSILFHDKPEPVLTEEKSETPGPQHTVIGRSVEGRPIDAYTYGNGRMRLLLVGGIHGGYEWNTVIFAYKFLDYLDLNPQVVPENITVTVIPSLNPDGVYKVIGKEGRFTEKDLVAGKSTVPGRFNAHEVDLNRNFDCQWKPESVWKNNPVSPGTKAFSEPEALALRDFVLKNTFRAVVFWHSQAGAVYASECGKGILPETLSIMNAYAKASGYLAVKSFDAYETSGDAEGWLASIGIPTIAVEFKTHETIEWAENLAGVKALFEYYDLLTP